MHYANGREAKVGDLVVGYGYNTSVRDLPLGSKERVESKRLAGTLVKAVPGQDVCNAEIEFVEVVDLTSGPAGSQNPMHFTNISRPRMAVGEPRLYQSPTGAVQAHFNCRDYTHVGALLHVEDVVELLGGLRADNHLVPAGKDTTIVAGSQFSTVPA